jgi:hypothetical protein
VTLVGFVYEFRSKILMNNFTVPALATRHTVRCLNGAGEVFLMTSRTCVVLAVRAFHPLANLQREALTTHLA